MYICSPSLSFKWNPPLYMRIIQYIHTTFIHYKTNEYGFRLLCNNIYININALRHSYMYVYLYTHSIIIYRYRLFSISISRAHNRCILIAHNNLYTSTYTPVYISYYGDEYHTYLYIIL